MQKIKRDDEVVVIAGKDKGKRGTVKRVLKDDRYIVSGVNMIKRHTKPNQKLRQGGILEREAPLAISNVMFLCPVTKKPTRLGIRRQEDGRRNLVDEVAEGQLPVQPALPELPGPHARLPG